MSIYIVTVATMYFYTTLHSLIWVKVGVSWLKCGFLSIILALMRGLKEGLYSIQNDERSQWNLVNFRLG